MREKLLFILCPSQLLWRLRLSSSHHWHQPQTKAVDAMTFLLAPPPAVCGSHQQQAGRAGQLHCWGLQERAVWGEAEVLLPGGPPVCRRQKQQRLPQQGEWKSSRSRPWAQQFALGSFLLRCSFINCQRRRNWTPSMDRKVSHLQLTKILYYL